MASQLRGLGRCGILGSVATLSATYPIGRKANASRGSNLRSVRHQTPTMVPAHDLLIRYMIIQRHRAAALSGQIAMRCRLALRVIDGGFSETSSFFR
jgi:hypothetical protein